MNNDFTFIPSLDADIEVPESGILSKPIFSDDRLRVTLFGMAQGQEMTEHTTTMEALIQVLDGNIDFTLGTEFRQASQGAWIQMQPNLPHSLLARSPSKLLLVVLRDSR